MKETPTQSQNANVGKLCMQNVELYLTFECLLKKTKSWQHCAASQRAHLFF